MSTDGIKWWPKIEVIKYSPASISALIRDLGHEPSGDELRALEAAGRISPDDIVRAEGNSLVTVGRDRIVDLICATGSPQAFTASRGVGGVGSSNTATTGVMTALQGGSQYYKAIAGTPTSVDGVITVATDFASGDANFAWEEWCWAIATAAPVSSASFATATTSGVMLNRAVQSLGTKVAGAAWTLNATVTIT